MSLHQQFMVSVMNVKKYHFMYNGFIQIFLILAKVLFSSTFGLKWWILLLSFGYLILFSS